MKATKDLIYKQAAINALERTKEKDPKGDIAVFYNKITDNKIAVIEALSSVQPEITEEDVREWCYKRGLTIIDNALYIEMKSRWSAPAQPEIIRCKDCYHYPNEYADCPMIGWARNENDFCSKAERITDE